MAFHSFITKKGLSRDSIVRVIECVKRAAKAKGVNALEAFDMVDSRYPGLRICYERYCKTKEIAVPFPDGVHVFLEDGQVEIENVSDLREQAEATVKHMAVNATGAREGEVVVGVHNISKHAVMKVASGIIPPSKDDLDKLRHFPEMWSVFLNKLSSIEFFRDLAVYERSAWIGANEHAGDYDICETGDVEVSVLDVGNSKFLTIDPETVSEVLSGPPILLSELRDKFPRKPGSNARRNTLIFFPHFWKVGGDVERVTEFEGPVYNLVSGGSFINGEDAAPAEITILKGLPGSYDEGGGQVETKQNIGVVLGGHADTPDYWSILATLVDQELINSVRASTNGFTAAGFKSLLQKIIRYAPYTVDGHSSDDVIRITFTMLLTHPGSFVPDIQRFVTGQESALKRLLVSILEDSYCSECGVLLKLAVMSLVAQRLPTGWKLPKKQYLECLETCTKAVNTRQYFKHDVKGGFEMVPYVVSVSNSNLQNASAILDEIRSFASDLAMTRYIALNPKGLSETRTIRPDDMRVWHCIDQHWAPEIAFLLPIDFVEGYRSVENGSKPFADLFKTVFMNVTGVNSRREGVGLTGRKVSEEHARIKRIVGEAQELLYRVKHPSVVSERSERAKTLQTDQDPQPYHLSAKLSQEWIAGCVGPIHVSGSPAAMVTLKPEDPYQMVAVRRPSRGMKDGTLTDERTNKAIADARKKMTQGISLSSFINPPIEEMKKAKIFLRQDEDGQDVYLFGTGKKNEELKEWSEVASIEQDIPVYPRDDSVDRWQDGLFARSVGMVDDAQNAFAEHLLNYETSVLRRCLSYLVSHRSVVEVARLSKDGGGTAQAVMLEDVGACQILLMACGMFGCAIRPAKGYASKFEILNAPLVWEIREVIREAISRGDEMERVDGGGDEWLSITDISKRRLKSYQKDVIETMVDKSQAGGKGHFLWMTVGLGKTICVLNYLKYLIDEGKMPKYAVYTLPKSAFATIVKEIKYFDGLDLNVLIPTKSWRKNAMAEYVVSNDTLMEGYINLIEHDHLRMMSDELISKAHESVVIIDEVHKALNDTKRTAIALELSRLSYDFVALTGTPVVDSNTYKLIWWLEQLVDFEVTDKNFWVAANGMISRQVNTGKEVEDLEVVAEMTDEENERYLELVPVGIGGSNPRASPKDIMDAFQVCYEACDREVVSRAMSYLSDDRGVMVVVKDKKHQQKVYDMLIAEGARKKDVLMMRDPISLTDETVKKGKTPDYKVVLVPLSMSMGYDLTRLNVMVSAVLPSNNACREQLRGRINRIIQKANVVTYVTVHCGILTYVLQKHKDAASISAVLKELAEEV